MNLAEIKITKLLITSRYGTLSPGDILRTDSEYARHLVEDCQGAEWKAVADQAPAAKPKKQINKS